MSKGHEEYPLIIFVEFVFLMFLDHLLFWKIAKWNTRSKGLREGICEFLKPSIKHFRILELLDKLRHWEGSPAL